MPTLRCIVVLMASSSERRSARGSVRSLSVSAATWLVCSGTPTVMLVDGGVGAGVGVFLVVVCAISVVALARLTIRSKRRVMKILLVHGGRRHARTTNG